MKCVEDTYNFLKMKNNSSLSIDNKLNTARGKQVNENRKNILPIIEVIISCGRQDLPFRGQRFW